MLELIYYLLYIAFTAVLSAEAVDTVAGCNAPGMIIPSSSPSVRGSTSSPLAIKSTTPSTGTCPPCTCGKSQYAITTFSQGKATGRANDMHGSYESTTSVGSVNPATTSRRSPPVTSHTGTPVPPKAASASPDNSPSPSVSSPESHVHSTTSLASLPTLSATPTTESSVQLDSKTASLTSILCATKAPSSAHVKPWGSTFKVTDASSAVARACNFEPHVLSRSTATVYYEAPSMSKEGNVVKMLFAAVAQGNCDIVFSRELCKHVLNSMISGHPSCPKDQGWTMGGMGISECGYFLLTGTPYDTRDPFADMLSSGDWNNNHYCDVKLNVECELET